MGAYGLRWEEQQTPWLEDDSKFISPFNDNILMKISALSPWSYILVRVHVSHWWVGGGGYKPTVLNRLFCLGVAAALSGYCEAVAMEMWVRVLMCQSSLVPVLAMKSKQLQLEKAADSSRI